MQAVSYLMLNSDTVLRTKGHDLRTVPIGTTLTFSVSFHDAVGERFYATNSRIDHRPNRVDLLQVVHGGSNDTLTARATSIGQTVLKVGACVCASRVTSHTMNAVRSRQL